MTIRRIGTAAGLAVSLSAAKTNLRITGNRQDELVEMWLRGISAHAEEIMQRSLITQEWCTTLDAFPEAIALRMPPLVSVSALKFYDESNVLQTLDPLDYLLDTESVPAYVVPAPGRAWPATIARVGAVQVFHRCGYGDSDSSIPPAIKLYLLAKLREQFDPAIGTLPPTGKPYTVSFIESMLDPFKVY